MKHSVVIITGLSGSGKTVALRTLEDNGFFCVDNLPITLIEAFVSTISAGKHDKKIGIGIDVREREFFPSFDSVLKTLREGYNLELIFLEAERDVIIRRFRETRRPHPLLSEDIRDIERAIEEEKRMLQPLREVSDRVIDTTSYTPHQLRFLISSFFRPVVSAGPPLVITIISFGFKYGAPLNLDLLFDARFLPNPNFVPSLKELNGTDKDVQDFIYDNKITAEFLNKVKDLLDFLIPHYISEGKRYLTIGFGCTGGRHRSPAIVEHMSSYIKERYKIEPEVVHRDIA